MALKWYVVHAYSQYEKKVATAIHERAERLGMQDRFEPVLHTQTLSPLMNGGGNLLLVLRVGMYDVPL